MNTNMLHTKQHLSICLNPDETDPSPCAFELSYMMSEQLVLVGMKMLERRWGANMVSCVLNIDEEEWRFSGSEVNHDLHAIIEALQSYARTYYWNTHGRINLTMEYYGEIAEFIENERYSSGKNLSAVNLGPKVALDYLEGMDQTQLKGVFYSCWQTDDYPDESKPDCGTLHAYGEKDGKFYHGELGFQRVAVSEAEGIWESDSIDHDLDATMNPEGENAAEIDRLSDKIANWGRMCQYVELHSARELEEYLKVVSDLRKLTYFYYHGAYVDKSKDDVRLLHVFLHDDGSYNLELAEV